ncbi:MAG: hypothetical protein IH946_07810 [Bacteroidetes bacterium]|nr:hypothetical protein [Bacteroidota bacterium]
MVRILKYAFVLGLLHMMLLVMFSCNRCKKTYCPYNSSCYRGECICAAGYEGTNCDITSKDKYLGNYWVTEDCHGGTGGGSGYFSSITDGNDVEDVFINNILNTGWFIEAEVQGNSIAIPSQTVGSMTIDGDGNYNPTNKRLTLYINHNLGGNSSQCTLSYFKQ